LLLSINDLIIYIIYTQHNKKCIIYVFLFLRLNNKYDIYIEFDEETNNKLNEELNFMKNNQQPTKYVYFFDTDLSESITIYSYIESNNNNGNCYSLEEKKTINLSIIPPHTINLKAYPYKLNPDASSTIKKINPKDYFLYSDIIKSLNINNNKYIYSEKLYKYLLKYSKKIASALFYELDKIYPEIKILDQESNSGYYLYKSNKQIKKEQEKRNIITSSLNNLKEKKNKLNDKLREKLPSISLQNTNNTTNIKSIDNIVYKIDKNKCQKKSSGSSGYSSVYNSSGYNSSGYNSGMNTAVYT
jgi:hypothetical protein